MFLRQMVQWNSGCQALTGVDGIDSDNLQAASYHLRDALYCRFYQSLDLFSLAIVKEFYSYNIIPFDQYACRGRGGNTREIAVWIEMPNLF